MSLGFITVSFTLSIDFSCSKSISIEDIYYTTILLMASLTNLFFLIVGVIGFFLTISFSSSSWILRLMATAYRVKVLLQLSCGLFCKLGAFVAVAWSLDFNELYLEQFWQIIGLVSWSNFQFCTLCRQLFVEIKAGPYIVGFEGDGGLYACFNKLRELILKFLLLFGQFLFVSWLLITV